MPLNITISHGSVPTNRQGICAALDVAEHNKTVNAICPAYALTPPDTVEVRVVTEAEIVKTMMMCSLPTKKFVQTDELTELALFLCSDSAASINRTALATVSSRTAQ